VWPRQWASGVIYVLRGGIERLKDLGLTGRGWWEVVRGREKGGGGSLGASGAVGEVRD